MPDFCGIFTRVYLSDASLRRAARAIRRRAVPVAVATTAALGVAAGVTVSAFTNASSISGDGTSAISISGDSADSGSSAAGSTSGDSISGDSISGDTATDVAAVAELPDVKPVTGNTSVVGYAPATTMTTRSTAVIPAVTPQRAPVVAPLRQTRVAPLLVVAPSTLSPAVL